MLIWKESFNVLQKILTSRSTTVTVSLWKQVLCFEFGVKVTVLNKIVYKYKTGQPVKQLQCLLWNIVTIAPSIELHGNSYKI